MLLAWLTEHLAVGWRLLTDTILESVVLGDLGAEISE